MSKKKATKDKSLHEAVRREITEPVELQADDEEGATAAESQLNIAPVEQSKGCLENPPETHEELKQSEAFLRDKVAELESLLKQNETEIERLWAEIQTLEENEESFTKKNRSLSAQLCHFQMLNQRKHKEIRDLTEKVHDLDWQLDETLCEKQTKMKLLKRKMKQKVKTVESNLQDLQEKRDLFLNENSRVAAELLKVEKDKDKLQEENLELRKTVDYLKDQLSLLQEELILADSEMRNPDAEPPPNGGPWFSSTKCLLIGLAVAVGGLLIYSAS